MDIQKLSRSIELTDIETSYIQLLQTLALQKEVSENQLSFLVSLARFTSSKFLLTYIKCVPQWYGMWVVREAMVSNPFLPKILQLELNEMITIMEMIRDLPALNDEEKKDQQQSVKLRLNNLKEEDAGVIERAVRNKATGEILDYPGDVFKPTLDYVLEAYELLIDEEDTFFDETADLPLLNLNIAQIEELKQIGSTSSDPQELKTLVYLGQGDLLQEVLSNPNLEEKWVMRWVENIPNPDFYYHLYQNKRWYHNSIIRKELLYNPYVPNDLRGALHYTDLALTHFRALEKLKHLKGTDPETVKLLVLALDQVPEEEFPFIIKQAKKHYSTVLKALQVYLQFRSGKIDGSQLGIGAIERTKALEQMDFEQLCNLLKESKDEDVLVFGLKHGSRSAFTSVLENSGLKTSLLIKNSRTFSKEQLGWLKKYPSIWKRKDLAGLLIHHPHLPVSMGMTILDTILTSIGDFVDILANPKVKAIELKNKATQTLLSRMKDQTMDANRAVLSQYGRKILFCLGDKILVWEDWWLDMFKAKAVPDEVVNLLIRNPRTPRTVLYEISMNATWISKPAMVEQMLLHPKMPPARVIQLFKKLPESMRKRVANNSTAPRVLKTLI